MFHILQGFVPEEPEKIVNREEFMSNSLREMLKNETYKNFNPFLGHIDPKADVSTFFKHLFRFRFLYTWYDIGAVILNKIFLESTTHTHIHVCMYVCLYVCMYVCKHTYISICIYIFHIFQ